MFGSPWSLSAIQRSLFGLYTLKRTMFPMQCFIGGMKEPCVYMHCHGLYLGVFMWWNMSRRGDCIAMYGWWNGFGGCSP